MFTKPRRNFRGRRRDSESDEEGKQGELRARNGVGKENGGAAAPPTAAALTAPAIQSPPTMGMAKSLSLPSMSVKAKENKAGSAQGGRVAPPPPPNTMLSFVGEEEG